MIQIIIILTKMTIKWLNVGVFGLLTRRNFRIFFLNIRMKNQVSIIYIYIIVLYSHNSF